jgi:hypothetical protein
VTLERPWDIPPDSTSHLVIVANRSQIVITGNHFSDASVAVQFYAQSYGIIVDGNQAERTGGMYGLSWDFWWEARKTRRFSICMFNQWLNNDLREGFVYQQGPWTDGVLGPAPGANNGKLDPPAITTLGNIVRNNRVGDRHTIGALLTGRHPFALTNFGVSEYLGRDTIIEGNTVTDTPVAIDVYPGYRDTVVRNNHVARSPVPLRDDGRNTWIDPEERRQLQQQAARERFGDLTEASSLWESVCLAAKTPVDASVPAMLIGLHLEKTANGLRLRTEPWAPPVTATAGYTTLEVAPDTVVSLPPAVEIVLRLDGAALRVRTE